MLKYKVILSLCSVVFFAAIRHAAATESGFASLFDGQTFAGWKLVNQHGPGYGITNGILFCQRGGGGNLFTEKEYEDFVFRFEFRLEPGSNNGIGLRAPLSGDAAYLGMEAQVLDDTTKKYGPLQPTQMHGSIYGVAASQTGFQKPLGEWNEEEITVQGRHVKVVLNGHVITDVNLNDVSHPETWQTHPGLLRERGHIGFLGHTEFAEFRNIRIKELPVKHQKNTPPPGFAPLFNGRNLHNWQSVALSPAQRAVMPPDEIATAQKTAHASMRKHWLVSDGALGHDGQGKKLATIKDYADFELVVDWKIKPGGGTSGIWLRGVPLVQICDPNSKDGQSGSGGLRHNKKNPHLPTLRADRPAGEWNRFRILMTGEKVTVFLNNQLVVHNVIMENSLEKESRIPPRGPIELQSHHDQVWFKNIFIREIPAVK